MPRLNTQILTATSVMSQIELDRLSLSNFRAPDMSLTFASAFDMKEIVDSIDFTPEVIDMILDVSGHYFYEHEGHTYVVTQYRNIEQLIRAVCGDNETDAAGHKTGLIESDTSALTTTHVFRNNHIDFIRELLYNVSLTALHKSFTI